MFRKLGGIALLVLAVSGCGGVPELNTATISEQPASKRNLSRAKQVVSACAQLPDTARAFRQLQSLGYKRSSGNVKLPNGNDLVLTNGATVKFDEVSFNDNDLKFTVSSTGCVVGVRDMTPAQSLALAQPLAQKFKAPTNAERGDGLSPHAVQAWNVFEPDRQINIVAYKTWPPGDPSFLAGRGAAVQMHYRQK